MGRLAFWLCRVFVAVLLVGTQVHLCLPEYATATGDPCTKCQGLTDNIAQPLGDFALVGAHGDCHDCCFVKPCDDHQPPRPVSPSSPLVWQCLAPCQFELTLPVLDQDDLPSWGAVVTHLATGPPRATTPRAPPAS
ncbi:MAG: hypothetical protein KF857_05295 [Fimbriimonadaceae bacterium]|nr:hypothetical protein [Fimbriimonadaceae bacterium]